LVPMPSSNDVPMSASTALSTLARPRLRPCAFACLRPAFTRSPIKARATRQSPFEHRLSCWRRCVGALLMEVEVGTRVEQWILAVGAMPEARISSASLTARFRIRSPACAQHLGDLTGGGVIRGADAGTGRRVKMKIDGDSVTLPSMPFDAWTQQGSKSDSCSLSRFSISMVGIGRGRLQKRRCNALRSESEVDYTMGFENTRMRKTGIQNKKTLIAGPANRQTAAKHFYARSGAAARTQRAVET
jgi:hypothetical protein